MTWKYGCKLVAVTEDLVLEVGLEPNCLRTCVALSGMSFSSFVVLLRLSWLSFILL